jgi:hypothetical protein
MDAHYKNQDESKNNYGQDRQQQSAGVMDEAQTDDRKKTSHKPKLDYQKRLVTRFFNAFQITPRAWPAVFQVSAIPSHWADDFTDKTVIVESGINGT